MAFKTLSQLTTAVNGFRSNGTDLVEWTNELLPLFQDMFVSLLSNNGTTQLQITEAGQSGIIRTIQPTGQAGSSHFPLVHQFGQAAAGDTYVPKLSIFAGAAVGQNLPGSTQSNYTAGFGINMNSNGTVENNFTGAISFNLEGFYLQGGGGTPLQEAHLIHNWKAGGGQRVFTYAGADDGTSSGITFNTHVVTFMDVATPAKQVAFDYYYNRADFKNLDIQIATNNRYLQGQQTNGTTVSLVGVNTRNNVVVGGSSNVLELGATGIIVGGDNGNGGGIISIGGNAAQPKSALYVFADAQTQGGNTFVFNVYNAANTYLYKQGLLTYTNGWCAWDNNDKALFRWHKDTPGEMITLLASGKILMAPDNTPLADNNYMLEVTRGGIYTNGFFKHAGTQLGFFNATTATKQSVTGAKSTNLQAVVTSLLAALSAYGLVTDSTT